MFVFLEEMRIVGNDRLDFAETLPTDALRQQYFTTIIFLKIVPGQMKWMSVFPLIPFHVFPYWTFKKYPFPVPPKYDHNHSISDRYENHRKYPSSM